MILKSLLGANGTDNRRYLAAKATRSGHQLDHVFDELGGTSREL
jgi:hypothetical protein